MASLKFVLRLQKEDNTGHYPIYIRVIKDRKTKFITTGVKLKVTEWDEENQRVKKNHQNSARINALLLKKLSDASGMIADSERKTNNISARRLKEAIKGKPTVNFFEYADTRLNKLALTHSISTCRNYKMDIKKFENYVNTRDLDFEDITALLLSDYINYLRKVRGNSTNTIIGSLKALSHMFTSANNEDLIPDTLFPFKKIRLKKERGTRTFLDNDQLEKLKNYKIEWAGKCGIFRDMFIFAVYAGGLRFSDVVSLKWSEYDLKEHRITKTIKKTNRQHQFKVASKASEIIAKYKKQNSNPEQFIFPVLEDVAFFEKSKENKSKEIARANSLCGFHLRRLGKELKFPFSLTFHLSRHTFATNALRNGMRIEYVSKLMDHGDISTTQIYAKIISHELDDAVDKYIY
ncbi:site-specific integrase [Kaistella flava (ex Peng et al. 2021)]|uniref:Site-specific integrase n=1 Tax=Kaistella flava (ex Peng et al. 2021) TaxID=2038776 RepID=A0A7M2Y9E8_9FLAO|nr:site-specific integrase [Kaistella flava (ex Peng et al. 2021)]QOW10275.1 site-specific integrase [Kaistella flava (ex Peng et al. 2021)]